MEPGLESAFKKAGIKLGGGLLMVAAMIGVRVITATPDGVEAEVAELEQIEAEIAAESAESPTAAPATEADAQSGSLVSRLGAQVRDRIPGAGPAGPDTERLVACDLSGRTQFMRAADCASRGGSSQDLD